jgi:hypothetical protein
MLNFLSHTNALAQNSLVHFLLVALLALLLSAAIMKIVWQMRRLPLLLCLQGQAIKLSNALTAWTTKNMRLERVRENTPAHLIATLGQAILYTLFSGYFFVFAMLVSIPAIGLLMSHPNWRALALFCLAIAAFAPGRYYQKQALDAKEKANAIWDACEDHQIRRIAATMGTSIGFPIVASAAAIFVGAFI